MCEDCWLWAWGAAGAVMFAGGALGLKLFADPSTDSESDRRRFRLALFNAALAILTGAITAQAFAGVAQDWASHLVKLPRIASALIVGCSANFLWPKIVRRLGGVVDQAKLPSLPGDAP